MTFLPFALLAALAQAPTPAQAAPAPTPTSTAPVPQEPAAPHATDATDAADAAGATGATDAPGAKADTGARTPSEPDGAVAQGPASGWQEADRILLVINDDLLTRGQLLRAFARRAREQNVRTPEDQRRIWNELFTATIRDRVQKQAGEAMGFDKAQIDRFARDDFERLTQSRGGVVGLTKALEKDGITAEELKELRRDAIYADLWKDSITGRGASTAARQSRDRYVRPGLVRFEYQLAVDSPARLAAIGGSEGELRVQQLVVDAAGFDTLERARELATQLRRRIVDGEDMSALVRQYSRVTDGDGVLVAASPSSLVRLFPGAADFVEHGKNGDVSDAILVENPRARAFVILRLLERKPAEVPPLDSHEVQRMVSEKLQKEIDDYRIELALRRAIASSYIWQADPPKAR
ncbi:MAG: hypothetical protein IPJ77_04720 [Planctomycetes bacterium]|nr:hypothetical protein [Planctomycetota bacterium]